MIPETGGTMQRRDRTVLVVDSDEEARKQLAAMLDRFAERVVEAGSVEAAWACIHPHRVDAVFVAWDFPEAGILEFLSGLQRVDRDVRRVLMAREADAGMLLQAMRHGVTDLLLKPYHAEEIHRTLARMFVPGPSGNPGRDAAQVRSMSTGLLGESPVFLRCIETARRAALADSTVLITGESGTGKEGFARLIHRESARASGPFIAVNCGAIPENLIESELFGYVRGAFTGAHADRPGRFALADGGTLFLDEIGEMPPAMQVRLLRVLQERVVEPLGGGGTVRADFRLIAATHRDLREAVRAGRFREDLWFRLHVVPVALPPLRERPGDAVLLARHYLAQFNARHGTSYTLDLVHEERLAGYPWPGNVRELVNAIERAVVLSDGGRLRLDLEATPFQGPATVREYVPAPAGGSVRERIRAVERDAILTALEACRWNKTRAAERLGISRRGLQYKVKAYGI